MLKTKSGRRSASRAGKLLLASSRYTLPTVLSARSTALMVAGSSHSAYRSDWERSGRRARLGGSSDEGESEFAPAGLAGASGLRLKASPIRTAKSSPLQKRPSARDEPGRVHTIDATKVRKRFWGHNTF